MGHAAAMAHPPRSALRIWSRWYAGAPSVGSVCAVRGPRRQRRGGPWSRVVVRAWREERERQEHAGVGVTVVMMMSGAIIIMGVVLLAGERVMSRRHVMDVPRGDVQASCRPGMGHHHRQGGEEAERENGAQR